MKLFPFRLGRSTASALTLLLALGLGISSCKKDDSPSTYSGENKIHLALVDGSQSQVLSTVQTEPVEVSIRLTQRAQQALTLNLTLEGDGAPYLQLANAQVNIPAGATSVSVRLTPQRMNEVNEERTATLRATSSLAVEGQISFQILPLKPWSPTSAQTALLEGYKAQGYDLTKLLGYHTVSGSADISGYDGYEYGKKGAPERARVVEIKNETMLVELSEKSTASQPVLKISYNAFGLNKLFKQLWYSQSIADEEYFNVHTDGEDTPGLAAAKAIGWSQTSPETFNVVLDNIRLDLQGKTFAFTGHRIEGIPAAIRKVLEEVIDEGPVVVPFTYETSVWERILAKVAAEPSFQERVTTTSEFNPYNILQATGIDEDKSSDIGTTEGRYVAPTGSFDLATGAMRFTFPFHLYNSERYSRITVTTAHK